jgi:hypothetical protein
VAPPGFDYEASLATIEKIKDRKPRTVCFSQYGYHRDPEYVIEESVNQLTDFYRLIKSMRKQGLNTNEIVQEIANELHEGKNHEGMSSGSMLRSIVMGYDIYFQRREKKG